MSRVHTKTIVIDKAGVEVNNRRVSLKWEEEPNQDKEVAQEWPQIVALLIGSITALTSGLIYSWTSPFILVLANDKENYDIQEHEGTFMSTIASLSLMVSSPFFYLLVNKIGRKRTILLSVVPQVICWMLTIVGSNVTWFYVSKIFGGVSDAMIFSALPLWTGEVSSPKIRGSWGCCVSVSYYAGMFLINILAALVPIRKMANVPFHHVPIVIEHTGKGERAFDIYSRLLKERIICLMGPINDLTSSITIAQLLFLQSESTTRPIHMYINSPGGVITSGLGIYDTMQYIQPPIATWCVGQCCSMASLLLAAGTRGMRHSLPNARIMIHQPSGGVVGQATDIKIQAEEILKIKQQINRLYEKHTEMPLEKVEISLERDNFMTPREAKDFGIIDVVLENPPKGKQAAPAGNNLEFDKFKLDKRFPGKDPHPSPHLTMWLQALNINHEIWKWSKFKCICQTFKPEDFRTQTFSGNKYLKADAVSSKLLNLSNLSQDSIATTSDLSQNTSILASTSQQTATTTDISQNTTILASTSQQPQSHLCKRRKF